MARKHLAVFVKGMAEKILSGVKSVEVRLSLHEVLPYKKVSKDDIIFLKISGGKIIGRVSVDNVLYYENLDKETVLNIQKEYNQEVSMDESFWQSKYSAKFATIIFLKKPTKFLASLVFRKTDRRPWVIIEEEGHRVDE
ncbi:hypothetical protein A2V71_02765 [Candidatus Berkelbacteria bacterium RBG_13_40_8]|uniref:ASCH domain-containing protein n=1 Tax=Candidatus Berkelbacteria bacterium RBG_13_40_8 TaxID=1797467 RepID=A0A1F5DMD6_9BACT|nr:MAG: hypothetical protein A2V71_02765 [Candidatus Berkelbacteria bacterium RBG_13_40_8]